MVVIEFRAPHASARVERRRGRFFLVDQSTNGTFVANESATSNASAVKPCWRAGPYCGFSALEERDQVFSRSSGAVPSRQSNAPVCSGAFFIGHDGAIFDRFCRGEGAVVVILPEAGFHEGLARLALSAFLWPSCCSGAHPVVLRICLAGKRLEQEQYGGLVTSAIFLW